MYIIILRNIINEDKIIVYADIVGDLLHYGHVKLFENCKYEWLDIFMAGFRAVSKLPPIPVPAVDRIWPFWGITSPCRPMAQLLLIKKIDKTIYSFILKF